MEVTPELINKFFQNKCLPNEVDTVVKYFSKNKGAFEKYMSKTEWDAIKVEENFNTDISQKILFRLKQQLFKKQVTKVVVISKSYFRHGVAAASIILVIVGSWWYIQQTNNTKNNIAVSNYTGTARINATQNKNWQIKTNTGKNPIRVKLQDGSIITLFKNTVIQYPQPFMGDTREILLNGDAFFEVAKNKLKPFIVYSGNLSTTALGTSFRIRAFKEEKADINIKLFTGKVLIKSTKKIANWKEDVFLLPGEQLTYNAQSTDVFVSKFNTDKRAIANDLVISNELKFNNTSLTEVMKKLAAFYNIKINYLNTDIEKMKFTGVINRSDNIQSILKIIAQMNDLKIKPMPDGFSISRPN